MSHVLRGHGLVVTYTASHWQSTYQSSHLTLIKKARKTFSQNVKPFNKHPTWTPQSVTDWLATAALEGLSLRVNIIIQQVWASLSAVDASYRTAQSEASVKKKVYMTRYATQVSSFCSQISTWSLAVNIIWQGKACKLLLLLAALTR